MKNNENADHFLLWSCLCEISYIGLCAICLNPYPLAQVTTQEEDGRVTNR